MTSINFEVFGLTRPGFELVGCGQDPAIFRFPDLSKRGSGRSTHSAKLTGLCTGAETGRCGELSNADISGL